MEVFNSEIAGKTVMDKWLEGLKKYGASAEPPHIQSYDRFLQTKALDSGAAYESLHERGLKKVLKEASGLTIKSQDRNIRLNFTGYKIETPGPDEELARQGITDYNREVVLETEVLFDNEHKWDSELRLGPFPCMTGWGTFIRKNRTGHAVEWSPTGYFYFSPGMHFLSAEGGRKRIIRFQPRFGPHFNLVGSVTKKGVRKRIRMGSVKIDLEEFLELLESERFFRGRGPVNAYFKTPFYDNIYFALGRDGRKAINRTCLAVNEEKYVTAGDVRVASEFLGADWPGAEDLNDLESYRVRLAGDRLEQAVRWSLFILMRKLAGNREKINKNSPVWFCMPYALEGSLGNFFKESCELFEDRNPVSILSSQRKISFGGPSGLDRKVTPLARRDLDTSHYGRLCAVETPESEGIGLDLFLAAYASIDEEGRIASPSRSVSGITMMPPANERRPFFGSSPGFADPGYGLRSLSSGPADGYVECMRRSRIGGRERTLIYDDRQEEAVMAENFPGQFLGYAASLIPFIGNNDGARAIMAAKNMKQALPLVNPEPPLIRTGFEALAAEAAGMIVRAKQTGRIRRIQRDKGLIVLENSEGKTIKVDIGRVRCGNTKIPVYRRPSVSPGQKVEAGEILAEGPSVKNGILSLGRNLLTAYMPWKGYNFEDAVVISERLVRDNLLTSFHEKEIRIPVWPGNIIKHQGPRGRDRRMLNINGIIRKGAEVVPGTVLMHTEKGEVTAWPGLEGEVYDVQTQYTGADLFAHYPEKIISIRILTERKIAVGDKLMGRHGNKGVIGLMLPEHEMPHMPDGTPVDVILNPHGVISRMNLGQIFETHLGMIAYKENTHFIIPPFHTTEANRLRDRLKRIGYPEGKSVLIDAKTGRGFDAPVTVGYQYIMKLHHLAADKLTVRQGGTGYDLVTRQALKGKKHNGGQKMGEMEFWALQAYNAKAIVKESLIDGAGRVVSHSDDKGDAGGEKQLNWTLWALAVYLKGLGLDLQLFYKTREKPVIVSKPEDITPDELVDFAITPSDMEKFTAGLREITVGDFHPFEIYRPVFFQCDKCGEIYDFSSKHWKRVRSDENKRRCKKLKCKGIIRRRVKEPIYVPRPGGLMDTSIIGDAGTREYRTRFAYVKLDCCVIHPWQIYISGSPLMKNLDDVKAAVIRDIAHGEKYVLLEGAEEDESEAGSILTNVQGQSILRNGGKAVTGPEALFRLLQLKNKEPPEGCFLSMIPVVPAAFRHYINAPETPIPSPLHKRYSELIKKNSFLKYLKTKKKSGPASIRKAEKGVQYAVERLMGYPGVAAGKSRGSISDHLTGKKGLLRKGLLGRRQDCSARAVIVPDPSLEINQAALPARIYDAFLPLTESKNAGFTVLLNRAPSLHRLSLQAFHAVRRTDNVIGLPPLVCAGFNADFDGDTMAVYLPLKRESIDEASRLLPERNLLSIANGDLNLHLAQDIIAGVYYASEKNDPFYIFGAESDKSFSGPVTKRILAEALKSAEEDLPRQTARLANVIMQWAFREATLAGITFSLFDIPFLSMAERRKYCQWLRETKEMRRKIVEPLYNLARQSPPNPLALMFASGARGNADQVSQLGGFRGILEGVKGKIPHVFLSNFLEGIPPMEYFMSLKASRKTLADKKLKTPVAGNFTRILVEACYPVAIVVEDCCAGRTKSIPGITVKIDSDNIRKRLIGRVIAENKGGLFRGSVITPEAMKEIEIKKIKSIRIRSPLTCKETEGICARCYGWDISQRRFPELGLPVGIIAGQSVGERGTQLSMQTFHTGGLAGSGISLEFVQSLLNLDGIITVKIKEGKIDVQNVYDFFMPYLRSIYTDSVDDRHFEIVLKRMIRNGYIRSIKDAANDENRHFLARASFRDAIRVIAKAAWNDGEKTSPGNKSKMILGLP